MESLVPIHNRYSYPVHHHYIPIYPLIAIGMSHQPPLYILPRIVAPCRSAHESPLTSSPATPFRYSRRVSRPSLSGGGPPTTRAVRVRAKPGWGQARVGPNKAEPNPRISPLSRLWNQSTQYGYPSTINFTTPTPTPSQQTHVVWWAWDSFEARKIPRTPA